MKNEQKKVDVTAVQKGLFVCATDRKWRLPFFRPKILKSVDVISRPEAKAIIGQDNDKAIVDCDRSKPSRENNLYRIMMANVLKTTRSSYN